MQYKFEVEKRDFSYLASGGVIKSTPKAPAFPVRLASELFLRAVNLLPYKNERYSVYDPCCGSGYLLSVLGIVHSEIISKIIASDIDKDILSLTEKNLSLFNKKGILDRFKELRKLREEYRKESHLNAISNLLQIRKVTVFSNINVDVFCSDILSNKILNSHIENTIDIVITDIPYGEQTIWKTSYPNNLKSSDHLFSLLENLTNVLKDGGIVVIVGKKDFTANHQLYIKVKSVKHGKRKAIFLKKIR